MTWVLSGSWFRDNNTWLLLFNTVATIVTFLMIFLIRNAQETAVLVPSNPGRRL